MSVEVRTLELVTDSTKSVSDLKSFEAAIDSLSSKLLAFDAAKDKAFKSLTSGWSRLGQQLKPIRLEVSFKGLAPKFRQFQRHLLAHLRETQAMVDRHKIVLRTATSMAGVAGAGTAAQASAAVATKQMSEQALFSSVMGKKYADYDLRRLQSRKDLPRMTADLDTLLRDHWLMTEKQIKGFYDKYKQLNVNDKQRMEAMLRQTFSPGMAMGRAQRQADWVADLAKQEGWHMPTIRPFLQEIQQKQKFVKEDPSKAALLDMARQYYASQGGKPGQRQMSIDDLAMSAGAAWYRDPRLMGPRFNKKIWQINEPPQTVHPRAMVAADRSQTFERIKVPEEFESNAQAYRKKIKAINDEIYKLQDAMLFPKTGMSDKDYQDKIQSKIKAFEKQRDALDKALTTLEGGKQASHAKDYYAAAAEKWEKTHGALPVRQTSTTQAALQAHNLKQEEKILKPYRDRLREINSEFERIKGHTDLGSQKRQDALMQEAGKLQVLEDNIKRAIGEYTKQGKQVGTATSPLVDTVNKKIAETEKLIQQYDRYAKSTRPDITKEDRAFWVKRKTELQEELSSLHASKKVIEDRIVTEQKLANIQKQRHTSQSRSAKQEIATHEQVLKRADEINKINQQAIKLHQKRESILKRLESIEERATRIGKYDTAQQAKSMAERYHADLFVDPDNIRKSTEAIRSAEKATNKLNAGLMATSHSGRTLSGVFAKFSIIMTGIAATIFVFQNIAMWMKALLGPTLEFNEALVKIRKNVGGTRDDFLQMRESVELATSEFGMQADKAASTLEKYVKMGFSRSMAQEYVLAEAKAHQDRFKEIEADTLNEAIEHFNREIKNFARAFGESGGLLQQAIEAIADFIERTRKAPKEQKDRQLQYAVNELAFMKKMSDEQIRRYILTDESHTIGGTSANRGKQTYQIINERGESSHELINKWVKENYGFNTTQDLMDAYIKSTLENVHSKAGSFYSEKELWEKELEQRAKQERGEKLGKAIKESDAYMTGYGESGGVRSLARQIEKIKADFNETINVLKGYPQFSERVNELIKIRDEYIQDAKDKQQEALQRASLNAFKKALDLGAQKWDFSSDSPEQFFKSFLDQRGFKVDTEEKQRAFQQAVDKFENKIVSWQNAFGRVAADDTLSKELNKIAALERKAVAEHLDLAKAYENLTGSTKPLKDVIEKLRYETYKAAVEKDFDWAFEAQYGLGLKQADQIHERYAVYRDSILDSGPMAEQQNKLRRINRIEEKAKQYPGYLEAVDPMLGGQITRQEFLDYQKQRIKDGDHYTQYQKAFFQKNPYGRIEDMTDKEKNIFEKQGHFTEMASAALMDYADEAEKTATKTYQAFQNAFSGMENTLVDFVMNGKLEWRSLAESIIADITRIQIQTAITGPLSKGFAPKSSGGGGWLSAAFDFVTGIFNEKGNMFNRYGLIPFATGGIVTKPTMFAFGNGGIGVMGEAGTEAIMPVIRTPSGDLGVKAVGVSGMTVNIYEAPGTRVTAERSDNGNELNIIVEQLENQLTGRINRGTGLGPFLDHRYQRQR